MTHSAATRCARPSNWPSPPRRSGSTARRASPHFARQLSSPFRCSLRSDADEPIEIGTGVIDMRYETALHGRGCRARTVAAGACSWREPRSPEPAWRAEAFGYSLDPDEARAKTSYSRRDRRCRVVAADVGGGPGARCSRAAAGARPCGADLVGAGSRQTAVWPASRAAPDELDTLLEDTQVPFDQLQPSRSECL